LCQASFVLRTRRPPERVPGDPILVVPSRHRRWSRRCYVRARWPANGLLSVVADPSSATHLILEALDSACDARRGTPSNGRFALRTRRQPRAPRAQRSDSGPSRVPQVLRTAPSGTTPVSR
jgi:hypothetical protein